MTETAAAKESVVRFMWAGACLAWFERKAARGSLPGRFIGLK